MPRDAELAHEEDVERSLEGPRDLEGDRHAAPRQREDDDAAAASVAAQRPGEETPGLGPVLERKLDHSPTLLLHASPGRREIEIRIRDTR